MSPTPLKALISGKKGEFSIKLPNAKYTVNVSMLGHKIVTTTVDPGEGDADLGMLKMTIDPKALKGIEVRPLVEIDATSVTYNILSDPERATSNMEQILAKVPMLSIDDYDGSIKLDGESKKFIILRNGRIDPVLSGMDVSYKEVMKRLPAMGFAKITVMLDPPEKYSDYAYVINIEVDKSMRLFGAVGEASSIYELRDNTFTPSMAIAGSAGKFRFSIGLEGYFDKSRTRTDELHREVFENNSTLSQIEKSHNDRHDYAFGFRTSFDLHKYHFLNLSVSQKYRENRTFSLTESSTTIGETQTGKQTQDNNSKFMSHSPQVDLNYQMEFKNPKRYIVASYKYTPEQSIDKRAYTTIDHLTETTEVTTNPLDVDNQQHLMVVNYTDKFWKKIELDQKLGYYHADYTQLSHIYNNSNSSDRGVEDIEKFNSLEYSVRRFDGNTMLKWKASKSVHFDTYLRWDYMTNKSHTTVTSGTNPPEVINQGGWLFSPRVSVTFLINKISDAEREKNKADLMKAIGGHLGKEALDYHSYGNTKRLTMSFDLRQSRPTYRQLSSYVDMSNPNNISVGNPNLNNVSRLSFNISYSDNKILSPSLRFGFSNNDIGTIWEIDSEGRTVKTLANNAKYRGASIRVYKSFKIAKNSFQIAPYFSYDETKIGDKTSQKFAVMASTSYMQPLIKKGILSMIFMLDYSDWWNSGYSGAKYGTSPLNLNITASGRTTLFKSTTVMYQLSMNCFNWGYDHKSFINDEHFSQTQNSYGLIVPPITARVSFGFGKFQVKPVRESRKGAVLEGFM